MEHNLAKRQGASTQFVGRAVTLLAVTYYFQIFKCQFFGGQKKKPFLSFIFVLEGLLCALPSFRYECKSSLLLAKRQGTSTQFVGRAVTLLAVRYYFQIFKCQFLAAKKKTVSFLHFRSGGLAVCFQV
jgi:hypothetical protein